MYLQSVFFLKRKISLNIIKRYECKYENRKKNEHEEQESINKQMIRVIGNNILRN